MSINEAIEVLKKNYRKELEAMHRDDIAVIYGRNNNIYDMIEDCIQVYEDLDLNYTDDEEMQALIDEAQEILKSKDYNL